MIPGHATQQLGAGAGPWRWCRAAKRGQWAVHLCINLAMLTGACNHSATATRLGSKEHWRPHAAGWRHPAPHQSNPGPQLVLVKRQPLLGWALRPACKSGWPSGTSNEPPCFAYEPAAGGMPCGCAQPWLACLASESPGQENT